MLLEARINEHAAIKGTRPPSHNILKNNRLCYAIHDITYQCDLPIRILVSYSVYKTCVKLTLLPLNMPVREMDVIENPLTSPYHIWP